MLNFIGLAVFIATLFSLPEANGVTAIGMARQVVIPALGLSKISDIRFKPLSRNLDRETVLSGTAENAENASFLIMGQAYTTFTILLPETQTLKLDGGGELPEEIIHVEEFHSFPQAGANGLLDVSGSQKLYVGSSRSALDKKQILGRYKGSYKITIIY